MMQRHEFEKKYFTGYYSPNVGKFDEKSLKKSKNWFYGWLSHISKYKKIDSGQDKTSLEIGCSSAAVSHLLEEKGYKAYASDISTYAVEKAKKLAKKTKKHIEFHNFDVEKGIPIKDKFDVIIAFEVIEHLSDPLKAIINMKKKLKNNGVLICSTPNKDYDMSSDPTHINVKTEIEWRGIFRKAGFKKIIIKQVSFLPFFYKFNKYFHLVLPIRVKSRFINSPLFILASENPVFLRTGMKPSVIREREEDT